MRANLEEGFLEGWGRPLHVVRVEGDPGTLHLLGKYPLLLQLCHKLADRLRWPRNGDSVNGVMTGGNDSTGTACLRLLPRQTCNGMSTTQLQQVGYIKIQFPVLLTVITFPTEQIISKNGYRMDSEFIGYCRPYH